MVKGLEVLNRNCCAGALAIANYCGKLLILWDKPGHGENKNIWCSVIALERDRGGDDVWGHVEWASVVLTVPSSYVFLHCRQEWGWTCFGSGLLAYKFQTSLIDSISYVIATIPWLLSSLFNTQILD
ncbi:hypothetical protein F2Q69_00055696 [Brassica cretica]|uniref:Uncharacterized protein n=1 Tax=Brassica cretica TaxID=69181 RepID=A0A8S9N5M2_BRACR|nr:hypothetical protein F2Q69_00055696 [Brassica cretica]